MSFYSLAKSPRGGSLSPGLLDSLLSAEEALVENEKHDDVVTMDAVEVAVDHADYVEKKKRPSLRVLHCWIRGQEAHPVD